MTENELKYYLGNVYETHGIPYTNDFEVGQSWIEYYKLNVEQGDFDSLDSEMYTNASQYNRSSTYKAVGRGDISVTNSVYLASSGYVYVCDIVFYSSLWLNYNADYYLSYVDNADVGTLVNTSHYRLGYSSQVIYTDYGGTYTPTGLKALGTDTDNVALIQVSPTHNPYNYGPMDSQNPAMFSVSVIYTASLPSNFDIDHEITLYSTNSLTGYAGYKTGFGIGYNQGLQDGGQEGVSSFGGTFSLLGNAFGSMAGLMETQVIGGLTIGALVGIPICVTIIVTLFKMMKK